MLPKELEFAPSLMPRKVIFITMALSGLLITAGFLHKSGRVKAATEAVTQWREARRTESAAEETAQAARVNREEAWRKKCERLRSLPVDTRPPLEFRGAQKTMPDVPLRTDQWSRQVNFPAGKYVSWVVSPDQGYYLVFGDGELYEVASPSQAKEYPNPGPIRFLAKSEGQSVNLEVHAPLATLNNSPR